MNALVKSFLTLVTLAYLVVLGYTALHFLSAYPGLSISQMPTRYISAQIGIGICVLSGFFLCAMAFGKSLNPLWPILPLAVSGALIASF